MDTCPGLVVVWSRGRPRFVTHRIPGTITIDHALLDEGPGLAAVYATLELDKTAAGLPALTVERRIRISPARGAHVELDGKPLTSIHSLSIKGLPAFIAAGRSVVALVADVRPFENHPPTRDGTFVIGSGLGPAIRAVDAAAHAEDHVSLRGPDAIVRMLALRYAEKLGTHAWFRPGGDQHLDHFLSTRPAVRTIIIELSRPLFDYDVTAIHTLLETDLRFVIVRRDDHYVEWLPPALATETIEVPRYAFDERVLVIATRANPDVKLDATTVAGLLDQAERIDDDRWNWLLERVIDSWDDADPPRLETLLLHLP